MKKIILLGLHTDPNLGDGLISECTRLLTEKALCELGLSDSVRTETCDIRGLDFREHLAGHTVRVNEINAIKLPKKKGVGGLAERGWCRVFPGGKRAARVKSERDRVRAELRAQADKRLAEYNAQRDAMLNDAARENALKTVDGDTAAMIVVGGGLIKYGGHQKLASKLEPYFRRADELGVPVMVNAVGVEGFDPDDGECLLLRELLNLGCVKLVSTRDDIDTLRESYIQRPDISVNKVPCPALWASEFFPRERKTAQDNKRPVIGLGMARGMLFSDNGIDITPERMDGIWNGVIDELERRGYDWRVFTNGYNGDQHYAQRFMEKRINAGRKGRAKKRAAEKQMSKLLPRPENVGQLIDMITSFDGIIACRLHAAITACSYGVPAAEMVWNVKQTLFGEWACVPERFIEPEKITPTALVDAVERAISEGYPPCGMDRRETYTQLKAFLEQWAAKGERDN